MKSYDDEKEQDRIAELETQSFYRRLMPYGSADVRAAIDFFIDAGLDGDDLADQVNEFSEDTGTKIAEVDICYVAYDHILQMARNKISEVLGYDFQNDLETGTEFYTYGNFMCTTYDYSEEARKDLTERLEAATDEQKDELRDDKFVVCFLRRVDIDALDEKKVGP